MDLTPLLTRLVEGIRALLPAHIVILYGRAALWAPCDPPLDEIEVAVVARSLGEDYVQTKLQLMELAAGLDPRIDVELLDASDGDPMNYIDMLLSRGRVIYRSNDPA